MIPGRLAPLLAIVALLVLLGTGGAGAASTPESTSRTFAIQVHLLVEGGPEHPAGPLLDGRVVARPSADAAAEPVVVELSKDRTHALELPAGGIWRLEVEAAGYWSAGELAWPGREEVALRLVPTGTVTGRVVVPPGAERPESLVARFAPEGELRGLGSATSPRQGSRDCPVDVDGRWRCEVPAGPSDLHLHAAGFASVFRFEMPIQPGAQTDLGAVALHPGASVVGSVDLASVRGAASPVRVELDTAGRGDSVGPQHRRPDVLAQTIEPDDRGFFQFRDLRSGVYTLVARAEGLAPSVLERVEVHEGRESRILHPLALAPLVSLQIHVDPPLPPDGDRWHVRLLQPEIAAGQITGTLDATGTWRGDGIRPGLYLVRVEGPHRNPWHEQRYEITGTSPPIEVRLPIVQVEGLLTIDGEPMRSRLLFERPSGGEVVGLVSSLDGALSGWLPQTGEWRISYLGRRREKHVVGLFRIEQREDGKPTWLDVELPETRVDGRVVDGSGRPVEDARVSAWRKEDERDHGYSIAKTDDEGRFFFRGLREGDYVIDALAGRRGSARKGVEIRERRDAEVELRLLGEVRMTGRVVGPDGRPVAAAEIHAYPRLSTPRRTRLVQRATGLDGEFVLSVPFDALELDLLLLPPGFAARLLRIPFGPGTVSDTPVVFGVDTVGGTLHLRPGGSLQEALAATLHSGRASTFFRPLQRWARLHGATPGPAAGWWLPQFAPGSYRLCSRGGDACTDGELTPGGVLVLETPAPAGASNGGAPEDP